MRWVLAFVVDGLLRLLKIRILAEGVARIWIAIVVGEVAAGNFDLDSVSLLEYVADRHQVDRIFVDGPGGQKFLFLE